MGERMDVLAMSSNNCSGTWNARRRALGSGAGVEVLGEISEARAVITVEDVNRPLKKGSLLLPAKAF